MSSHTQAHTHTPTAPKTQAQPHKHGHTHTHSRPAPTSSCDRDRLVSSPLVFMMCTVFTPCTQHQHQQYQHHVAAVVVAVVVAVVFIIVAAAVAANMYCTMLPFLTKQLLPPAQGARPPTLVPSVSFFHDRRSCCCSHGPGWLCHAMQLKKTQDSQRHTGGKAGNTAPKGVTATATASRAGTQGQRGGGRVGKSSQPLPCQTQAPRSATPPHVAHAHSAGICDAQSL